jgi:hypothetical protein
VKAGEPDTNFGASPLLEADAAPGERTFLRVGLSGLGSRPPASARLRLQVADAYGAASDSGGRIRAVPSCTWEEGTITWNTQPAMATTVLATAGAVATGDLVEFDVTSAIRGDGTYCFALDTVSPNGVLYHAREGVGAAPALTLALSATTSSTTTTTVASTSTTTRIATTTTTLPGAAGVVVADVSAREDAPVTNFGAAASLEVGERPKARAFVRVAVTGVGGRRVAHARLQLQVAGVPGAGSVSGGRLHGLDDCGWDERAVTWKRQPKMAGIIDEIGSVAPGDVVEFDVTSAVRGDGVYCFGLENRSEDHVVYGSREGRERKPGLVIGLAP